MQVIATAGHVDHGKSTLVRALTGMEPDRWAEERRRGMTIDLGFAWTTLSSGEQIAFVDVPGHERFTTNMLAGVGPVPAVLLVIAADEGWAAQTEEHVIALDALGVTHGLVAVTRSDLADPAAAIEQARDRLAATTLAGIPAVSVSGSTGAGLDALRAGLDALAKALPASRPRGADPALGGPFIHGSGQRHGGHRNTHSGHPAAGDVLELGDASVSRCEPCSASASRQQTVSASRSRGRQLQKRPARGHPARRCLADARGMACAPRVIDARVGGGELPTHVVLHVGSRRPFRRIGSQARSRRGGGNVCRATHPRNAAAPPGR